MHVEVRTIRDGADHLEGVLRLADGKIVAEPETTLLRSMLEESVYDWKTKQAYNAADDPEGFLRALHQQYRSAYLRVSAPIEDEGGNTKGREG